MNRASIDTWLERTILALVLGLLILGTLAFGGVRPSEFIILEWLILAAAALWILRIWLAPNFRFLWPPITWAILPFVGYALWRWRVSDIEFVAREEVLQICLAALLFLVVVNNLYNQESTRIMSCTLLFLAMSIAIYGVFQWLRASDKVWWFTRPDSYEGRASGTFICPNHLAAYLEMILPIGIALTLIGRMRPVLRVIAAYASFAILVGVAATQSRAGWLCAAIGLAVLVLVWLQKKGQRWLAVLMFAAVAGTGYWLYERSVAPRVEATYLTGHGRDIRLRLWVSALQIWKDHPWTGVGPDHFDHRYRHYREAVDRTQGRPGRAHNDYVNTLADYGAVGLALALLPLAFAAWSVARSWPYVQRGGGDFGGKKSNRTAIVLGASAGVIALLAHSFLDFNMHIPAIAFLAVTLLAMLASHIRFATERYWFTARWPVALAATLVLLGCLGFLVPSAVSRSREVALLRRADRLPDGSREKIALLQRAFAIEPKNVSTALAIGEQLRAIAWMGRADTDRRAQEALVWFQRAVALNKWEVPGYIRIGMCLDWIGRHDEAGPYFRKALELDPNHWEARAMMGWHEFQLDHFKEAHDWLMKSLSLNWMNNPIARTYLALCEKGMAEEKLNKLPR